MVVAQFPQKRQGCSSELMGRSLMELITAQPNDLSEAAKKQTKSKKKNDTGAEVHFPTGLHQKHNHTP